MSQQPADPLPVDLRDYVEFDLEGAAGRRVFATDVVAVDVVCLEPGQAVQARSFPTADAIYTVLGGVAWVVTDDAEVTLQALQSVMMPATRSHGIRNNTADPLVLLVVVSPPDDAPPAHLGPSVEPDPAVGRPPRGLLERLRRPTGGD